MLSVHSVLSFCRSFLSLSLLFGCLASTTAPVLAGPTNTTIDDTDPAFSFAGSKWNAITPEDPCPECSVRPNPNLTFNSTCHGGSFVGLTGSFQFEGSAVYLFGITTGDQTGEISFVIDDGAPTNFDLNTVSLSVLHIYNTLLFSSSGLSNGQHIVSWTLTTVTGPEPFSSAGAHVALFDYAVVTSDIGSVSSSSDSANSNGLNAAIGSNTVTATESVTSTVVQTQISSGSPSSSLPTLTKLTSSSISLPAAFESAIGSASSSFNFASSGVVISSSGNSPLTTSPTAPSATDRASPSKSNTELTVTAVVGSTGGAILILCIILFVRRKRYIDRHPENVTPFVIESGNGLHVIREARFHSEKRRTMGSMSERDHPDTRDNHFGTAEHYAFSGPLTPSTTVDEPSTNGPGIEQMQDRIQLLEHLLRQADRAELNIDDTSPPPYK